MTSHNDAHSEPSGAKPTAEAQPNWTWLQGRLKVGSTDGLDAWLESQLADLELLFEDFITGKSLNRSIRQQFVNERSKPQSDSI